MPIRIVETRSAGSPAESHIFIGSTALRLLEAELQAYCQRTVRGRSFLIAGHRGAGKTTLVDAAIQRVANTFLSQRARQASASSTPDFVLRPLLVPLQGPNLLPPDAPDTNVKPATPDAANPPSAKSEPSSADAGTATAPPANKIAAPKDDAGSPPAEPQLGPTETALIQIILSLYRALANEFVEAYTNSIYRRIAPRPFVSFPPGRIGPSPIPVAELELAAQFELDLDEYPGKARLRDYWRRIGALEAGILFPQSTNRPAGSGYRELVALASACEAYQRICGHFTRKQESTSDAARESRAALELEAKGNVLLKPLAVLLTGGAVGAGLAASGAGSSLSAFAGAIAALASMVGVRYTGSRSRRQASNRSELFIPNLSVATLDRVLPVLIQRILRAGLAPIFLVDELDKVDLSVRINDMVKRLKKLVAEQAFFCFLTDRKYFEELSGRTADAPYPIEYTYYSHQLFVVYTHQDLHLYLNQVLQPTLIRTETPSTPDDPLPSSADTPSPSTPTSAAPSAQASAPPSPATQPVVDEDTIDAQILPYLILHASQMHTIDVRRQLLALRNENGEVSYRPGEIRGHPRFRYALLIQLAIETALESPDMTSELELRPAFLQIARDALYFISRRWPKCPDVLDLTDGEGRLCLEAYLRKRMETDVNLASAKQPPPGDPESIEVPSSDFLFGQVRALALAFTNVETVRKAASGRGVPQVVLDNLPKDPLLYEVDKNKYRWHCHPSGRNVDTVVAGPKAAVRLTPTPATWNNEVGIIEEFELGLSERLKGLTPPILSNQLGILPTTPAWAATEQACRRLRASESANADYADRDTDIACVREYTVNLRQNAKAFSQALISSKLLSSGSNFPDDVTPLVILSELLRLRHVTAEAAREKLEQLFAELRDNGIASDDAPLAFELPHRDSISEWLRHIAGVANDPQRRFAPATEGADKLINEAWAYWRARLTVSTIAVRDPDLAVLYCALQLKGPGRYLNVDPSDISISGWSYTFLAGLNQKLSEPGEMPQPWLTALAATRLGFGPSVTRSTPLMARIKATRQDFPDNVVSSQAPGAAAIVFALSGTRTQTWTPQPAFPTLHLPAYYLQVYSGSNWSAIISELRQLNFSILALDGEDFSSSVSSESASETQTPPLSPLEDYPYLNAPISGLGFTLHDTIPVIVADPTAKRNWPPNFRPIAPENPEELFRATQSLRENSPTRA